MQPDRFLQQLRADGATLLAAARRAGFDMPVPRLTWSVRELVVHTGAVHRWSADIVGRALERNETGGSVAFHPEPSLPDDALARWFADGLDALLDTLAAAPDDLQAWTFTRGAPAKAFWSRRQAHETAVHRADAEAAAGESAGFDPAFAQDGLAELVGGFATQRAFATTQAGTLGLLATDGDSWLVTFGGERNTAVPVAGPVAAAADATVAGTSSQLYLWAWNRDSPAVEAGDAAVLDLWRAIRIT